MRYRIPLFLALQLVGCRTQEPGRRVGGLVIEPGYATAAPAGDGGAAYFTVRNEAARADTIRSVSVDGASTAHLHTMTKAGGLMRMTMLEPAVVPAHGGLTLAVGEAHLMFEGMSRPIRLGDTLTVRLRFARAGEVALPLVVRPYGG